jgi:hypothetical protein
MVPGSTDIPISFDAAHFTREGSRYFINLIADKLFGTPKQNAAAPNDAVRR